MRPVHAWAAAAAVTIAAAVAVGQPIPPVQPTPGENRLAPAERDADRSTNDAAKAAGDSAKTVPGTSGRSTVADARHSTAATRPATAAAAVDPAAVRRALAEVVRCAVTPDDLKRFSRRLAEADRAKLAATPTFDQGYGSALDGRIARVTQKWSAAFGHDPAVVDVAGVFADDFAAVAPGPAGGATVTVRAANGLPELTVTLVRDPGGDLRVAAADGLTAEALRRNLSDQLTAFADDAKTWSDNEVGAYRLLAHRVLTAVAGRATP